MKISQEHLIKKDLKRKSRRYLCLYVELLNGKKIWYRASPKLQYAAIQAKHIGENLPAYLIRHYINVPITVYFGHDKGIIGVGKIIRYKFMSVPSDMLCTRSQLIDSKRLDHLFLAYHYLRHDYSAYSRLNIFVDLYNWKTRKKQNKNQARPCLV